MRDRETERENKQSTAVRRGMLILGAILIAVLTVFAGYRIFRRIASSKMRDFMYPFLNTAIPKEEKNVVQSLMMNSKIDLARRLAAVTRERNELAAQNAMLRSREQENLQLRSLAGVTRKKNFVPVFAEVLTRSIPTWRERFVINRGEKDGIAPGDIVLAADPSGGLAVTGRIKEVSLHTSVVVTLFSGECRLSVMLASGLCGGMEYDPEHRGLIIRYLPADSTYAEKEAVVTTGISSYTPPRLRIGEVKADPSGNVAVIRDHMFAEVAIQPYVKIDTIRFVVIYTRKVPK